jgi:uncharacterized membrane protein YbaN (DUF454 family)
MRETAMLKIVRLIVGITLILIGLPGLILPLLPGSVLILAGILLLTVDLPLFDQLVSRIEPRYPKRAKSLRKIREVLQKYS